MSKEQAQRKIVIQNGIKTILSILESLPVENEKMDMLIKEAKSNALTLYINFERDFAIAPIDPDECSL